MAVIAKAVLIVVAVKTVIMHISIVTVTNIVWMLMMSMITSPNYRNLSYAS